MRIPLSKTEWMVRVLIDHFHLQSKKDPYLEVFAKCFALQNMSGCRKFPENDLVQYREGSGCLPPYVRAEFYKLCPWEKPAIEEKPPDIVPMAAE